MDPLARLPAKPLASAMQRIAVLVDADLGLADEVESGEEVGPRAARRRIDAGELLRVFLGAVRIRLLDARSAAPGSSGRRNLRRSYRAAARRRPPCPGC